MEKGNRKHDDELKIWCIVRKDLNMPAGKLGVQTGHAFSSVLWNAPEDVANQYMSDSIQAKILLEINSETTLLNAFEKCKDANLPVAIIKDIGRTVFAEPTYTAVAVGPCFRSQLPKYIQKLQLYKENTSIL